MRVTDEKIEHYLDNGAENGLYTQSFVTDLLMDLKEAREEIKRLKVLVKHEKSLANASEQHAFLIERWLAEANEKIGRLEK